MEANVFCTLLSVNETKDWPWGMAKRGALGEGKSSDHGLEGGNSAERGGE